MCNSGWCITTMVGADRRNPGGRGASRTARSNPVNRPHASGRDRSNDRRVDVTFRCAGKAPSGSFLQISELVDRNRECVRRAEGENILPVIAEESSLKMHATMPGEMSKTATIHVVNDTRGLDLDTQVCCPRVMTISTLCPSLSR